MGHRGDVEFTFEQVLDGEKPLFLPSPETPPGSPKTTPTTTCPMTGPRNAG
jgi:hypothetical protein